MRRDNAGRLNKEKLIFLAAALLAACALYVFFSSGPLPLALAPPTTREPGPGIVEIIPVLRAAKPIDALVDNGEPRNSPFEPFPPHWRTCGGDFGACNKRDISVPIPVDEKKGSAKVDRPAPAILSEVDYLGVIVDGKRRALLKPKDGSAPFLVAEGDAIPHYAYTVSKIEPQAIEIKDSEDRPFTLKDQSFEKTARAR